MKIKHIFMGVLVVASGSFGAGCGDPNNEQVAPGYSKLTLEEAKSRLNETQLRHNGKMKPQGAFDAKLPAGQ
jgi:hypothetical protein